MKMKSILVSKILQMVGENIQIVVYNLADLKFKRSIPWNPSSGQVEVCGIAVDGEKN